MRTGTRPQLKPKNPDYDHYDFAYLRKCMQAKGYVEDGELTARGKSCFILIYSAEEAACYLPDDEISRFLYELFPN